MWLCRRGCTLALATAQPDAMVLGRLLSTSVPTSRNLTPWPLSSRRPQCWGDTLLFAKGGAVVSIHCLLPQTVALGTPYPSAASARAGNHSEWVT